jgi:hypothetical protein
MVVGDPGHPDLANCPPDWLCFHAPRRHTAILVNRKVKEKKFEVHHTSEPEQPDPPLYVPLVLLSSLASLRPESNSEDSNGKEEASDPNPRPHDPTVPSLYPLCIGVL